MKSKFSLILGYVNRALNNPAQEKNVLLSSILEFENLKEWKSRAVSNPIITNQTGLWAPGTVQIENISRTKHSAMHVGSYVLTHTISASVEGDQLLKLLCKNTGKSEKKVNKSKSKSEKKVNKIKRQLHSWNFMQRWLINYLSSVIHWFN